MTTFLDLTNGLYNAISQGLGFPPGSNFQLVQPSPPLPGGTTDPILWNYMNNIPPFSLTQNYISSGGNQFFSDYQALMSALVPSVTVNFQADIGAATYNQWIAYVSALNPPPSPTSLPSTFFSWALIHAPAVASKGASDLSALLLDPIGRAQMALMPYTSIGGSQAAPPNWNEGYTQLVSQLANAPRGSFNVGDVQANSNTSSSWTQGQNSGFFGLWGGSSSTSSQSQTYASAGVSLSCSFAHVTTFTPSPGSWYDSGAMGLAFANQTGNPWNPSSSINWQNTFGPNGNMQRFAANMIVVDAMTVTAISTATFSTADQQTITNNSGAGLWPFYSTNSSSSSTTTSSFNQAGAMTTTISTQPGVPTVVGISVLSAAVFLGHAVEGAKLHARLLQQHRGKTALA